MRTALAAGLGFLVFFLLGFTVPSAPARHPGVPSGITNPAVYVFDPHASGAINGIVNVTPKVATGSSGTACTQSQAIGVYDDGGSVGVNCIDSFSGTFSATTNTSPTVPSVNQNTLYAYQIDAGWPVFPMSLDNFFGLPQQAGIFSVFPVLSTTGHWSVMCMLPQQWGSNVIFSYQTSTASTTGSLSGVNWANTSLITRSKFVRISGAGGTGQTESIKSSPVNPVWRGDSAGAGGWVSWTRFGVATTFAGTRWFMGLYLSSAGLPAGSSDPNVVSDSVYVGCNAADTNFSICSNDNSGNATCNTLGGSFPCNTNGAYYDLWLSAPPNGGYIHYYIERLDSAAIATGDVTSDLPRNTVQLQWLDWASNGTQASAVSFDFGGVCTVGNN